MSNLNQKTIILNNITFVLKNKTVYNGYPMVYFISTLNSETEIFDNVCYKSMSEAGIWRYALENSNGQFHKGHNYIVSTNISIELQSFINENYDNLETVDASLYYKFIKEENDRHKEIYKYIYDKNRFIKEDIFDIFQKCDTTNKCFYKLSQQEDFNGFLKAIKKEIEQLKGGFSFLKKKDPLIKKQTISDLEIKKLTISKPEIIKEKQEQTKYSSYHINMINGLIIKINDHKNIYDLLKNKNKSKDTIVKNFKEEQKNQEIEKIKKDKTLNENEKKEAIKNFSKKYNNGDLHFYDHANIIKYIYIIMTILMEANFKIISSPDEVSKNKYVYKFNNDISFER